MSGAVLSSVCRVVSQLGFTWAEPAREDLAGSAGANDLHLLRILFHSVLYLYIKTRFGLLVILHARKRNLLLKKKARLQLGSDHMEKAGMAAWHYWSLDLPGSSAASPVFDRLMLLRSLGRFSFRDVNETNVRLRTRGEKKALLLGKSPDKPGWSLMQSRPHFM